MDELFPVGVLDNWGLTYGRDISESTKDIDSFKNIETTKTHSFVTNKLKNRSYKRKSILSEDLLMN